MFEEISKDKQIEEMAKVIARRSKAFRNPNVAFMTTAIKTAESLYNESYRKKRKGFWGVAREYNEYLMSYQIKTVCSLCGHTLGYEGCVIKTNFCPNCGARMKGDE